MWVDRRDFSIFFLVSIQLGFSLPFLALFLRNGSAHTVKSRAKNPVIKPDLDEQQFGCSVAKSRNIVPPLEADDARYSLM